MQRLLKILVIAIIGLFAFWFFYLRNAREIKLMNKGELIVKKIYEFNYINKKLPQSLIEIGIDEDEKTEQYLAYKKVDSINFTVWIGIDSEKSKFYYSDSKKWEDSFRKIPNN